MEVCVRCRLLRKPKSRYDIIMFNSKPLSTILAKAKANIANESVQSQSFSLDRSKQIRHPEESEGTEEISCLLTVRKTNS